jgi:hypothetical protein
MSGQASLMSGWLRRWALDERQTSRFVLFVVTATVAWSLVPLTARASGDSGQAPSQDVVAAAQSGLAALLAPDLPRGRATRLGFNTRLEIEQATTGEAFPVYAMQPDRLLGLSSNQDLSTLSALALTWLFIVRSGGAPRCVLTVERVGGGWAAVSIGGSELARELQAASAAWPASAGYERRFIRVYQANAEFLEVFKSGTALGSVPFVSARLAMRLAPGFDARDLHGAAETIRVLRPIVAAAIMSNR